MKYQLAQVNIAKFRLPQDHPENADFVNNIDRVNQMAEAQPGFIWRFVGSAEDEFDEANIAFNMSVWSDIKSLSNFVYMNKAHRSIMRRRKEWFENIDFHMALWWVESGKQPTVEEAQKRLAYLSENGVSDYAFTFKHPYPEPE